MDAVDLVRLLTETTLAASAALLLVLCLRRPLRHAFGPGVAHGLWLVVPAAMIAVLLPAAIAPAVPMALATADVPLVASRSSSSPGVAGVTWLAGAWLLGALVATGLFTQQQRAFRAGLGRLRDRGDGTRQADCIAGLPAAIGLWQPLIVVPADFDTRYTPRQQRLMQAHERMHIRCGDLQLNALATALRCAFWFNPLVHLAARHFRHDQELACDQRVIARHQYARRDYGEAMLKTQLALQPLPLGCNWAAFDRSHPLKERIAMLKQPVPSVSRWIAGSTFVVALLLSAGIAAWAAQPPRVVENQAAFAPPAPPLPPDAPPAAPVPPAAPSTQTAAPGVAPPATPAAPAPALAPPAPAPPAQPANAPAPGYPTAARANRMSGKVVLAIDVEAQGTPIAADVEESEPIRVLDEAAVDAASNPVRSKEPDVKPGGGPTATIAHIAPSEALKSRADPGGGDLICERRKQLGSNMMKRVCMTALQHAEAKERAKEDLRQLGRCAGNEVACTGSIGP